MKGKIIKGNIADLVIMDGFELHNFEGYIDRFSLNSEMFLYKERSYYGRVNQVYINGKNVLNQTECSKWLYEININSFYISVLIFLTL